VKYNKWLCFTVDHKIQHCWGKKENTKYKFNHINDTCTYECEILRKYNKA